MITKLKEKLISFDSKKESQITICVIAYCLFAIACIMFTNVTKQFEITCNIIEHIGICLIIIWRAILSIREKRKDIIMRNNIINLILSDYNAIWMYSYLIVIKILQNVNLSEMSSFIAIIVAIILGIIIVIAIDKISSSVSKYFNEKLK